MQPTNPPVPKNVARKGALMFWRQAAAPAAAPMLMKFWRPSIISNGISIRPMYKPNREK